MTDSQASCWAPAVLLAGFDAGAPAPVFGASPGGSALRDLPGFGVFGDQPSPATGGGGGEDASSLPAQDVMEVWADSDEG